MTTTQTHYCTWILATAWLVCVRLVIVWAFQVLRPYSKPLKQDSSNVKLMTEWVNYVKTSIYTLKARNVYSLKRVLNLLMICLWVSPFSVSVAWMAVTCALRMYDWRCTMGGGGGANELNAEALLCCRPSYSSMTATSVRRWRSFQYEYYSTKNASYVQWCLLAGVIGSCFPYLNAFATHNILHTMFTTIQFSECTTLTGPSARLWLQWNGILPVITSIK